MVDLCVQTLFTEQGIKLSLDIGSELLWQGGGGGAPGARCLAGVSQMSAGHFLEGPSCRAPTAAGADALCLLRSPSPRSWADAGWAWHLPSTWGGKN